MRNNGEIKQDLERISTMHWEEFLKGMWRDFVINANALDEP